MAQTIYHGSYTIIEQPKFMDGRFTKDLQQWILLHNSRSIKLQDGQADYDTPIVNIYARVLKKILPLKSRNSRT